MTLPEPRHRCQFDGSPFARANCTAASAAMALDAYSGHAIVVTPDDIRRHQSDQEGGLSCTDAAEAWKYYGQTLDVSRPTFAALVKRLRAGDGAMVQGSYAKVPDLYAVQDSFDGGHCVYVQRIEDRPSGEPVARLHDPLSPSGAIYWPLPVLQAYYAGLPSGRVAWGHGVYAPPVTPTHKVVVTSIRLRTAPNLSAPIDRRYSRGNVARAEGTSSGSRYAIGGRRSNTWLRIVAVGSGKNARRLARPLYSAALGWERR